VIEIAFTKLHGAENDFLITWGEDVPRDVDLPAFARKICARTTGVGADGWMLAWRTADGLRTRLFNADGSEPEISGNGTRCAAAFAHLSHVAEGDVLITTAAGPKRLRLIDQQASQFTFEMDMGLPQIEELRACLILEGREWDASILNVGNPQCAIFVKELPEDWRAIAMEAEGLKRFPNRSNVSMVKLIGPHAIEAVFYERGAGETRSSGTGSTGAAVASILRGAVSSPVDIQTPAGSLILRWDESVFLTGPAELICKGSFFSKAESLRRV
jgi:diaminopimelate epimerase